MTNRKDIPYETSEPHARSHPNPKGIGFSRSHFIRGILEQQKAYKGRIRGILGAYKEYGLC